MTGPLAGIRVVDVTEGAQGPWAGALLADLGADVIKVEKPGGEMMRRSGPLKGGHALPNAGLNHGKRNIVLDLKDPAGREILLRLIRDADVFMENWRRGVAERLQVDYDVLAPINPRLIYASASGFGQTGKYAHKATVDYISQAMGGYFSLTGPEGGPGERPRFIAIDFTSPLTFVQAILLALLAREDSGRGQWARCSQTETMIAVGAVRAAEYFASGETPQPWGSGSAHVVPSQAFLAADGYILVECPAEDTWRALCETLELPELADDPRFDSNAQRVERREELLPILKQAFLCHSGDRWIERLEAAGVPCGPARRDIEDLYGEPQVVANELLVDREHPEMGAVRTNAVPWLFSRTPAEYGELAVAMDRDREELLAELGVPRPRRRDHGRRRPAMSAPLEGIRVLDLTEGDGAPFSAMQLGDAGADVLKVEPLAGDWARPLGPPFDGADGPLFMGMNRNKRSIALDLERDEGRAVVRDLAAGADILVECFPRAGDAERLGLDYETLSAANRSLIYCDLSLLERRGPDADKPATDLIVQGLSGLTRFIGERGKEPLRFGSNYAGVTAAMYAVQAILAALFWRRQSGEGQYVETSCLRAMIASQQNYLAAHSDPDDFSGPFYSAHLRSPVRGYPTKDRNIEFTASYARDPGAFQLLLERVGILDEVQADPRFADRELVAEDQIALQPYLDRAFLDRSSEDVLQLLEEFGLMCAPVHDYDSMFHDEGILEQDMLLTVEHPTRGEVRTWGLPWKLDTPGSVRLAPPTLGEHTDAILAEIGYDEQRIAALRADGVVR